MASQLDFAGQLSAARTALADLGVSDVPLVAIAKGPDRDAGREWLHMDGIPAFQLPPRDPVLYYLQRLRDEAHRFAITTHRAGRSKALIRSELDEIDGIGAARKRALLNHFGSAHAHPLFATRSRPARAAKIGRERKGSLGCNFVIAAAAGKSRAWVLTAKRRFTDQVGYDTRS